MYRLLIVIFIGYVLYKFLSHKDVFILIQGKKDFDANVLKTLEHTEMVYKVRSKAYDQMDARNNNSDKGNWNYAIVARRFRDDISLKKYVSIIRSFGFIEEMKDVTTLVANYAPLVYGYNIFQKLWARIGGAPSRPLQASINSTRKCLSEDAMSLDEVHTISLWNVHNQDELVLYTNFILWEAFPAFNIQLSYNGKPESADWSTFVILKFKHYKDFCELIASQLYENYVKHKHNSVGSSYAYVVELL